MAIIRAARPDSNFYVLNKSISEDKRLSWGARGLLIFLLGKPDHWTVSPANLVNETAASAKQSGRDAVYALLKELLTVGYLQRVQSKKGDGTFGGTDYMVSEVAIAPVEQTASPLTEKPEAGAPLTEKPHTANPHTANPTQVSTDFKQELTQSKDSLLSEAANATPAAPSKKEAPTSASWESYKAAYLKRYGVEPLRNGKVNAALSTVVKTVGGEKAPQLVAHYLKLEGFYAQCQHDIGVLVRDIQKVWNHMHKAAAPVAGKPKSMDDYKRIDYHAGVNPDGSF
jgi:hypothetical protein